MSLTFSLLKHGDQRVMELYYRANKIWDDIFSNYRGDSQRLAHILWDQQRRFEEIVFGLPDLNRWHAQEIMVFSGLSYFLDRDDDNGRHLAFTVSEAFEMSYCSIEVKGLAKRVSTLFFLRRY